MRRRRRLRGGAGAEVAYKDRVDTSPAKRVRSSSPASLRPSLPITFSSSSSGGDGSESSSSSTVSRSNSTGQILASSKGSPYSSGSNQVEVVDESDAWERLLSDFERVDRAEARLQVRASLRLVKMLASKLNSATDKSLFVHWIESNLKLRRRVFDVAVQLCDEMNASKTSLLALVLITLVLGSEDLIVECLEVADVETIIRLAYLNPQPAVFDESPQSRRRRSRSTMQHGFNGECLHDEFERAWAMLDWSDELVHRDCASVVASNVIARLSFNSSALEKLTSSHKIIALVCHIVCEDAESLLRLQDELCLPYRRRVARMTYMLMTLENAIQAGGHAIQNHLANVKILVPRIGSVLQFGVQRQLWKGQSKAFRSSHSAVLAALRLVCNICNHNDRAISQVRGAKVDDIVVKLFMLGSNSPRDADVITYSLGLLINTVERNAEIRRSVMDQDGFCDALSSLFHEQSEAWKQYFATSSPTKEQSADAELENNMIAGYSALLVGCLVKDSPQNLKKIQVNSIWSSNGNRFNDVFSILKWFVSFSTRLHPEMVETLQSMKEIVTVIAPIAASEQCAERLKACRASALDELEESCSKDEKIML